MQLSSYRYPCTLLVPCCTLLRRESGVPPLLHGGNAAAARRRGCCTATRLLHGGGALGRRARANFRCTVAANSSTEGSRTVTYGGGRDISRARDVTPPTLYPRMRFRDVIFVPGWRRCDCCSTHRVGTTWFGCCEDGAARGCGTLHAAGLVPLRVSVHTDLCACRGLARGAETQRSLAGTRT